MGQTASRKNNARAARGISRCGATTSAFPGVVKRNSNERNANIFQKVGLSYFPVMNKHLYLLRGSREEPYESFSRRMRALGEQVARQPEVRALKYVATEETPPALSIIPFRKDRVAAFSVYQDRDDPLAGVLREQSGLKGIYRAEEAFPVAYEKNWPNGNPTPGVCLLTLFRRKPGLDYATFMDRWHHGHTPLSLRLHPLWHYARNVLTEKVHPESEDWDGLVDEYVKTRTELLNPYKFFGNSPLFPYHMWEVYRDVKGFLDYKSTETYLATEYHLK